MESVFLTVLNMSITGGLIIAALAMIRLMFKNLPRRYSYMLWAIPAFRLLCPISVSSVVSFFNLLKPRAVEQNRMEYIVPPAAEYAAPTLPADPVITVVPPTYHDPMEDVVKEVPKTLSLGEIAGMIWAAVAVGMFLWAIISYVSVRKKVMYSEKADGYDICPNIPSPFVFGIFRPRIYLPLGISPEDTECILEHERAHIKRRDYLVKLLTVPVLALHWFNPLVWLGIRLMTADMELSCDELALKDCSDGYKKVYANALLNISMKQNGISLNGVLGFGESDIKGRIKGVLKMKKPKVWATVIAVAVVIAVSVCLLTNAVSKTDEGAALPDEIDGYISYEKADIPALTSAEPADGKVLFAKAEVGDVTAYLLGEGVYRDGDDSEAVFARRLLVGISTDGKTVNATCPAPAEFVGVSQEHYKIYTENVSAYLSAFDMELPIIELSYIGEDTTIGAFYAVKDGEPRLLMGDMSETGGEAAGVCFEYTALQEVQFSAKPNTLVFASMNSQGIEYTFDFDSIKADEYTGPHFTARYVGAEAAPMSMTEIEGLAKMYFIQQHFGIDECDAEIVQYDRGGMTVINITAADSDGSEITAQYTVDSDTGIGWDENNEFVSLKSARSKLDVVKTVEDFLLYERIYIYDSLVYPSNDPADGVVLDGEYYFPVSEEGFTEWQQLYDFMHGLFSDEIAEASLSDGHYREYNGKTYSRDAGGIGWSVSRDWKSANDMVDNSTVKLEVYRELLSEGDEGEYMISVLWLERDGNNWKITDYETHYTTDADGYETLIDLDNIDAESTAAAPPSREELENIIEEYLSEHVELSGVNWSYDYTADDEKQGGVIPVLFANGVYVMIEIEKQDGGWQVIDTVEYRDIIEYLDEVGGVPGITHRTYGVLMMGGNVRKGLNGWELCSDLGTFKVDFTLPAEWESDATVAYLNGANVFKISPPFPAEDYEPDIFRSFPAGTKYPQTFNASEGEYSDITVYEETEHVPTEQEPYLMFSRCRADGNSGSYEYVNYVVETQNGYGAVVTFYVAEGFDLDEDICLDVLRSVKINPFRTSEDKDEKFVSLINCDLELTRALYTDYLVLKDDTVERGGVTYYRVSDGGWFKSYDSTIAKIKEVYDDGFANGILSGLYGRLEIINVDGKLYRSEGIELDIPAPESFKFTSDAETSTSVQGEIEDGTRYLFVLTNDGWKIANRWNGPWTAVLVGTEEESSGDEPDDEYVELNGVYVGDEDGKYLFSFAYYGPTGNKESEAMWIDTYIDMDFELDGGEYFKHQVMYPADLQQAEFVKISGILSTDENGQKYFKRIDKVTVRHEVWFDIME